jgi:hypothetical protein
MRRGRRSIITAHILRACGKVDAEGSSTTKPFTAPEMFQAANGGQWLNRISVVHTDQNRVFNMARDPHTADALATPALPAPWPPSHIQADFAVRMYPQGRLTDHVASLMAFDFSDAPACVRKVSVRGAGLLSAYTGVQAPGASTVLFARAPGSGSQFWVVASDGSVQSGQTCLGRRGANLPPCINSLHLLAGNVYTVTSYDEAGEQLGRFPVVLRQGMLTANLVERQDELFASALRLDTPLADLRSGQRVSLSWRMPLCMPQAGSIMRAELALTGSDGEVYTSRRDDGSTVFAGPRVSLLVSALPSGVQVLSGRVLVCLRGVGLAQFITESALG